MTPPPSKRQFGPPNDGIHNDIPRPILTLIIGHISFLVPFFTNVHIPYTSTPITSPAPLGSRLYLYVVAARMENIWTRMLPRTLSCKDKTRTKKNNPLKETTGKLRAIAHANPSDKSNKPHMIPKQTSSHIHTHPPPSHLLPR